RQFFQDSEYQIISWLFQHRYLNFLQTKNLITLLNKEAFELFLLISQGAHEFHRYDRPIQEVYGEELAEEGLSRFDLQQVIDYYQKRSQIWQTMIPAIESPYQRPYLTNSDLFFQSDHQNIALGDVKKKLVSVLNGHSIHDLAASLKWDELKFAKFLHPYVVDGAILLREPEPPYDQLPQTSLLIPSPTLPATLSPVNLPELDASVGRPTVALEAQQHPRTVVCIDDSSNMLDTIEQYLKKEQLSVFKISEPAKAVLQLRQIKPDMILLDVGMPLINGYELCRMLRNSPRFKTIPIVMVTGRDGFLNKAKAQVVGATDYLTKPFTESDLLEVVFKHLT
ncbi:MAG: response regulator, partial [Cyanobacteria bacterium CRU_2_1]|nr:response regulator [Cyanobacteria bacterium CRU_2_1]